MLSPRLVTALGTGWPQRIAQPPDHIAHGAEPIHIAGGKRAYFFHASLVVVPKLDAGAIEEGNKEPVHRGRPTESAPRQFQFFDHQGMQEPGKIGARRHAHAGEGLFDCAGPANACAALDHQDLLAGPRKIGRTSQAVVACADDDDVPGFRRQLAKRDRQSDFA